MKSIGLIPARSGSKRVLNKNTKLLCGKPLIAYTIEAANNSKLLDRVIVSTDSEAIAEVAIKFGAEVPFLRPQNISMDDTPDQPVMAHMIEWLQNNENYSFDLLAYLRPTTPFKTATFIDNAIKYIQRDQIFSSVRSVTKAEGVFHPFWMYKKNNNVLQSFIDNVDISKYYQSQLLPSCYRLNGVIDVLRRAEIINNKLNPYGRKIGAFVIDEKYSIDIDNEFDLLLCEFILRNNVI